MRIRNLTPHAVTLLGVDGTIVAELASEGIASVRPVTTTAPPVALDGGEIPVTHVGFGEVTGLPEPEDGVILFVSALVAGQARRADVASPGQCPTGGHKGCPLCRHEDGRVKASHGIAFPS